MNSQKIQDSRYATDTNLTWCITIIITYCNIPRGTKIIKTHTKKRIDYGDAQKVVTSLWRQKMFGIDFLIRFGIGMLISACVMMLYHFAENETRRVFYRLNYDI
jgi:hypothetical protein